MNSSIEQAIQLFNGAGLELEVFGKDRFRILNNGVEVNTYTGLHLLEHLNWIVGEIRMIWYLQGQSDGIKIQQQIVLQALGVTIKQ